MMLFWLMSHHVTLLNIVDRSSSVFALKVSAGDPIRVWRQYPPMASVVGSFRTWQIRYHDTSWDSTYSEKMWKACCQKQNSSLNLMRTFCWSTLISTEVQFPRQLILWSPGSVKIDQRALKESWGEREDAEDCSALEQGRMRETRETSERRIFMESWAPTCERCSIG